MIARKKITDLFLPICTVMEVYHNRIKRNELIDNAMKKKLMTLLVAGVALGARPASAENIGDSRRAQK